MSKSNGDTYDDNVVVVTRPNYLPYIHIPYSSYLAARAQHPHAKLYIYEGKAPAGYKIVAYPILMEKPEEVADETQPQ